jgi:hypothetical protein
VVLHLQDSLLWGCLYVYLVLQFPVILMMVVPSHCLFVMSAVSVALCSVGLSRAETHSEK